MTSSSFLWFKRSAVGFAVTVLTVIACSSSGDPQGRAATNEGVDASSASGGDGGNVANAGGGGVADDAAGGGIDTGGLDGSTGGSGGSSDTESTDGGLDGSDIDGGADAASNNPCDTDNGGCDPLVTCNSSGSTVTCDPCPTGYDDPNSDGTSCSLVDCGALNGPSNGSVDTAGGTTYDETATYSCDSGYAVSGSATRTCQADGNWSGSAPTCGDLNACEDTPYCTATYPCQDLAPPSPYYVCRGQFADWTPSNSPTTFTVNDHAAEDTVTDSRSGLEWQQTVDATSYNWANAKTYCENLTYGTLNDWRLPTKAELESIVDFGVANPAIGAVAFPSTPAAVFWSSSTYVGTADYSWTIDFTDGGSDFVDTTTLSRVRCVRSDAPVSASTGSGGAPPGRYTVNANDTVLDTFTGLLWQQTVPAAPAGCNGANCTPAEALAYCAALSLAGSNDWRLPEISELLTLTDPTHDHPTIDAAAFPSTPPEFFWSATGEVGSVVYTWGASFSHGRALPNGFSEEYRVRCVR